ncbi:MAG: VWA domain-containing protein [Candidatus Methylacidiphilales bacterium]|nr:VWA domain-containing protein [Candidatus Methylacidiphilales bacterium]
MTVRFLPGLLERITAKGRISPFGGILALSATGHLLLLVAIHGLPLHAIRKGSSPVLPAAFAEGLNRPEIETAQKEEVFFRIPVAGTPANVGEPSSPAVPATSPATITTRSPSSPASAVPGAATGAARPSSPPNAGTAASGPRTAPTFFGRPFTGGTVVFVIDVSGSMLEKSGKGNRLREAFDGVARALEGLEAGQRFNILLFADRVDAFRPGPVSAESGQVLAARRYLESGVDCGGSTNLQDALRLALSMEADTLLLLSDGEANSEDAAIVAEVNHLQNRRGRRTRIDAVGFYLTGGSRPEVLLQRLARDSGGQYASWKPQDIRR